MIDISLVMFFHEHNSFDYFDDCAMRITTKEEEISNIGGLRYEIQMTCGYASRRNSLYPYDIAIYLSRLYDKCNQRGLFDD